MINMFKVFTNENVYSRLETVIKSGMIGEGSEVEEFKKELEYRFENKNLLPLNSATSALTLAMRLLNLKVNDEVITTPFTMIATNVAIKTTPAKIVFADIDESMNISYESIKSKISRNTKAIVLTHVGGMPCDMEKINSLGIPVVADCAHAIDTYYKGKHISHWADFSAFSFQSIKQLTTGDGGVLVIKHDGLYNRAESLKWFGMTRIVPEGKTRLQHQMTADVWDWGYKFHMNNISAAIGLANLPSLDAIVYAHRANANAYNGAFKKLPHVKLLKETPDATSSYWVYGLLVENRDKFIKYMEENGIETTPMWRRNDEYSCFNNNCSSFNYDEPLINMDKLQDKIVFIPVGWWISSGERDHIIKCVKTYEP